MKVVFAIKRLEQAAGGAERVLCQVCSALATRGFEVTIVSFDRPGSQSFYALSDAVAWKRLAIGDTGRAAGVVESFRRMRALRRCVRDLQPDAVVAFMHSMFVPAAAALTGTSIPVIGSEHIVPDHYRAHPLQWLLLNAAAFRLRGMTVLSDAVRATYPAWVRRRMTVMPNPVATVARANAARAPDSPQVVLNVGRLDPQKDQANLLRAFAGILPQHPDWRLRIVGEGPLRGQLEQLIAQLDIVEYVTLPGLVRDIDTEYRQAAIFAMPSRYESFGLATAEAMAHGLPVVGFRDCPGTNELVVDGATGVLVDNAPNRAAALAAGLAELIADPAKRGRYGNAGRDRIEALNGAEVVYDRWEALLREACAGGTRS